MGSQTCCSVLPQELLEDWGLLHWRSLSSVLGYGVRLGAVTMQTRQEDAPDPSSPQVQEDMSDHLQLVITTHELLLHPSEMSSCVS